MATKQTKKLTKENLAPVKYNKIEEKKDEKSVEDLLNESISSLSLEVEPANTSEVQEVSEKKSESATLNTVEELVGALQNIDKEFENITDKDYYPEDAIVDIPPSLDLEKMEVPEIDGDKIRSEVAQEEKFKTRKEKDSLIAETESKTEEKNRAKEVATNNAYKEQESIREIYDDYKVSVESDAIKRGLARSSVALLSIEGVEEARAKELVKVAEKLASTINELENDIVKLQQELNSSLDRLDLELAENINSEIASRIEKLEENRNEAIEFNNNVNKLEAEYQLKRLDKVDEATKLEEELAQKYQGFAENDKREKKVQLALDYFASMDKTTALNIIVSSPELASVLGNAYYDLYYYTMRR